MRKINCKRLLQCIVFVLLSTQTMAGIDKAMIEFRKTPLKKALEKISEVYRVTFTYDPTVVESGIVVSLERKERTLQEVLDHLSGRAGLSFMQSGDMIGVKQARQPAAPPLQQDITITGKVLDAQDQPLAGVSVTVKGSNRGVVTTNDGDFRITVQKGSVLVFSLVDYTPMEINAGESTAVKITLQLRAGAMKEVVVTALGVRKEKAKVAYAVQEVKGEVLQKAPESNVASNMVGKVAGLSVYTKSTLFENPEVYLRGGSTLVVIDGVPTQTDFWNINPNDIESINVLKGTAAASLYGSLGINGAIMITTKKGKGGANGMEISYNTTTQFQAGFLRVPDTQKQYGMGWDGYYAFVNGKGGGGWYDDYGYVWGPKLDVPDPNTPSGFTEYPQYNSEYDPNQLFPFTQAGSSGTSHYKPMAWRSKGKNNLKNFLDNEMATTHNISIAGKTDKSDYRVSVSHTYQKGQVPNTKLNSTYLSLAGSLKVTDKLRIESSISYNKQYSPNYPQTGYGPTNFFYNILLWMGPDVDIRDLRDYWKPAGGRTSGSNFIPYGVKDIQQFNYNYSWYNNPYFLAYEFQRAYTNDVIVAQLNGTYDFTSDLQLLLRTGITNNNAQSELKIPYSYINYGTDAAPKGNYSLGNSSNLLMVSDVLLTYKKTLFEDFSLTASGGGSHRFSQIKSNYARTNGGLTVPKSYNIASSINPLSAGGANPDVDNARFEKQTSSLFGYVDLGYKNMAYAQRLDIHFAKTV
jgi:TonB-dependent SusC/RagA subfamily outer membrane receptor